MVKVLLTGATGFLGSHLLEAFISQGFNVIVLKRSSSETWRIKELLTKAKSYDIDNISLKAIFELEQPEIIVHTACNYGRDKNGIIDIVNTNLIFGLNLLENAINNNVKSFINTDTLLPKNINDYSLSKTQLTEWLQKYSEHIQVINVKIEHMYGIKDDKKKFIPWLLDKMINADEEINLTSGAQKRDFIYIDDVVEAYSLVLNKRKDLQNWNDFDLGTNIFTPVKDMVLTIAKEMESTVGKPVIHRLKFGTIQYRKGDIMEPVLDNSNLTSLGWKPKIKIEEGVQKILKYYYEISD